ncbi:MULTISPECIES: serine hydrolase [Chryseobacterium]|uniref:D-alanyl-D-alanine carboxypeptidase n=1 Tax=Chryseobacterium geocarposphaerae TaxID=1416776 RepID=A0ABU1LES4_9FLAO|nr:MULTISPECIES: serine hydrolase domain-containing protein [Chryseobacterium]MDR6405220.1 D-alanyl-D-alanine carboxypeptidase [Chryseobacterium geocarposphaerae]MDR6697379.1 D-alanyl-D-alanine carboxypeptidase [Chryseobacterium ginsenosidimutans]
MKKLKLLTLSLFLPFIFAGCGDNETEKDYQLELDAVMKNIHSNLQRDLNTDVPSLSVYIVSPRGTYFSTVKGTNGSVVTPNTYFRFASNTKNFTSTAILKMMQDGWLNLDDKITANIPGTTVSYTPDVADWNFPHKNEITIRQILQHNAGIYDLTNDASQYNIGGETYAEHMLTTNPDFQFSASDYAKVLKDHNLTYGPPNTVYHYSNTGYTILSEIVARIYSQKTNSIKTYGDFMFDQIVGPGSKKPLGIKFPELASDKQLPSPYVKGLIKFSSHDEVTDQKNASAHIGEGNGVGTMVMLSDYIRTLMKGQNVLYASSAELMRTSKGPATTSGYALGCSDFTGIGYGHNGATEGYLSLMAYDPKSDVSVVVLFPFWDVRSDEKFIRCLNTLNTTAIEAKRTLGY